MPAAPRTPGQRIETVTKNPLQTFFARLAALLRPGAGPKKPVTPQCGFCGEKGHTEEDCPQAAKYKLFNVDRE